MDKPPPEFLLALGNDPDKFGTLVLLYWDRLPTSYFENLGFSHWSSVLHALLQSVKSFSKLTLFQTRAHEKCLSSLARTARTPSQKLLAYDKNAGNKLVQRKLLHELLDQATTADEWLDIFYRSKPRSIAEKLALSRIAKLALGREKRDQILADAPPNSPLWRAFAQKVPIGHTNLIWPSVG